MVNALYAQIVRSKAIPFELKVPSKHTLVAMEELEQGEARMYDSVDQMFKL